MSAFALPLYRLKMLNLVFYAVFCPSVDAHQFSFKKSSTWKNKTTIKKKMASRVMTHDHNICIHTVVS